MTSSTALNEARRATELSALADGDPIDLIVIGGGITGVGIALDAATRGLSVALVEKHDLAFGTSRWSSKLVHGGLRYLATGNIGIARRSAVERGILMTRNAPHLVRAMPQLVPLLPSMNTASRALVRFGFAAGDGLRNLAGTPASTLPRSRRIDDHAPERVEPGLPHPGFDRQVPGAHARHQRDVGPKVGGGEIRLGGPGGKVRQQLTHVLCTGHSQLLYSLCSIFDLPPTNSAIDRTLALC